MLLSALLLLLHLLAAAFWVGGMALMQLAVRPSAAQTLEPPERPRFMAATLRRFLRGVGVAIVVLLGSGVAMVLLGGGPGSMHWGVHAMIVIGLVMMGLYDHLRRTPFAQLERAVAAGDWSAAAQRLPVIRRLVNVNLGLGIAVFASAVLGPALQAAAQ
jgi:uncharacterized membrane protein